MKKGENMSIFVASDLHGSYFYGKKMVHAIRQEEPERLLLLGDILYHGPRNPLPEGYDPMALATLLNGLSLPILAVRGNCDSEVDQQVLHFPILADYSLLYGGKRTIFVTHGHIFNINDLPQLAQGDILLHGHTHVPSWQAFGQDQYYINPGSVSLPKEGSDRGYLMIYDDRLEWKTLDGTAYHRFVL